MAAISKLVAVMFFPEVGSAASFQSQIALKTSTMVVCVWPEVLISKPGGSKFDP